MFLRFWASLVFIMITAGFNVYAETHGNGIKYSLVEFRLVDVDGGDGYELGGAYRINEKFYAGLSLQNLDLGPLDLDVMEISGGYIVPYRKIDIAFEVGLIDADVAGGSESGYSLAAGGRGFVSPTVELRGFMRRVDVVNADTFIDLGADYFVSDQLSLGVTVELNSDADAFTFGGRYYF